MRADFRLHPMRLAALVACIVGFAVSLTVDAGPPEPDRRSRSPGLGAPKDPQVGPQIDPRRVTWRRLEYRASRFGLSATTVVDLDLAGHGATISFATRAPGNRSTDTVEFHPHDATARSRDKQKHGSKPYAKRYSFHPGRVSMERSEPAAADPKDDATAWSRRSDEDFQAPPGTCRSVVDPSAILYLASARDWHRIGPKFEACTFSRGRFSRLVVQSVGEEEIQVDVEVVDAEGRVTRVRGPRRTRVLSIGAQPLEDGGEERLEVLGLEEDIRMYVDAESGLPVRLSGRMDVLGKVEVKLQRAEHGASAEAP